jgi:hypothetical protein
LARKEQRGSQKLEREIERQLVAVGRENAAHPAEKGGDLLREVLVKKQRELKDCSINQFFARSRLSVHVLTLII